MTQATAKANTLQNQLHNHGQAACMHTAVILNITQSIIYSVPTEETIIAMNYHSLSELIENKITKSIIM